MIHEPIDMLDQPTDPPEETEGEPKFDKDTQRDYSLVDALMDITLSQRMDNISVTIDKLMQTIGKRQAE